MREMTAISDPREPDLTERSAGGVAGGSRGNPERLERRAELELVERLCAGNAKAFELFADTYLPALLRFARRRLPGHPELARDIAQSTACVVVERLSSFRGDSSLMTWIFACCRNEIATHFRRAGRRPVEVELDDEADFDSALPGPESELLASERIELVHEALERLPPMQARAMEWRYVEGLAVDEIARRLDATYKSAESLLSRGRAAFRRSYLRLAEGAPDGTPPRVMTWGGRP
jgi:RNA polymerase sigma-70 factor (ECF subfamily)